MTRGLRRSDGSPKRLVIPSLFALVVIALVSFVSVNMGAAPEGSDEGPPLIKRSDSTVPVAAPAPPARRTAESFSARDPFEPVGPGNGSNGGSGNGTNDPSTPTSRRVVLVDIFVEDGERRATVRVDGREHTVAEGETFARNFRLIDLTARCATFMFGDERFTLCIGQEVRK